MRRLGILRLPLLALAARTATLPAQVPTDSARADSARAVITYLAGGTVYLEVGRLQGVTEATRFTVWREGREIAALAATYVSSRRTASRVVTQSLAPAVGDSVHYAPRYEASVVAVPSGAAGQVASATRRPRGPRTFWGRVGVRYLVIDQPGGRTMHQPSLDLRLDGQQLGGGAMGLAVDVRMQRTTVATDDGSEVVPAGRTRVYQAAIVHQRTRGGTRFAVGRQFATALSPLGIFDGLAVDVHGRHWSAGGLAGTQPDLATFAPTLSRAEYGLWLQRHSVPGAKGAWSFTLGGVGAYDRGEIDREFLYLRGTLSTRRFSFYAAQEVDVNRGWKRELASGFMSPTSSFVTAQFSPADVVQFSGGFDSRRSVRLYRDFVNPEIAFDDALRQGEWGDVTVRASRHLRMSAGVRSSDGSGGTSQSTTASLVASQLTRLGLGMRLRTTGFTGPFSEGRLSSAAIEAGPSGTWRLSLNAGVRTSGMPGAGTTDRLTWVGGDLDVAINRSLYLMLSTYRESGSPTASIQSYGSLTWRF